VGRVKYDGRIVSILLVAALVVKVTGPIDPVWKESGAIIPLRRRKGSAVASSVLTIREHQEQ
jgi:hypothetical protein